MIRDTDPSNVPAELLAGIRTNHKGLQLVELHQARGRGGYSPVAGERWRLKRKGEDPTHEETPDDEAHVIAEELWKAACAVRRKSGGDQRFGASLFNITASGTMKPVLVKFDVPVDELLEHVESSSPEANARATFTHELVAYASKLHETNGSMANTYAEGMKKMFDSLGNTLEKVSDMLPRLLALRFDAAESEVRAMLSQLGAKKNDDWKEVGRNLKDLVKSPIGIAAAAKLLGVPAEEAAKMLALADDEPSTTSSSNSTALRELIEKLGKSLTSEQQSKLLAGLGLDALRHLQQATKSTDDAKCRTHVVAFFKSLGEDDSPRWKALEETLSDEQKSLVVRAVELLEQPS